MHTFARFFNSLSPRVILMSGAITLFLGVAFRIGVFFYGRFLYESLLKESAEFGGTSIAVSDAVARINVGNITSFVVILTGGVFVVLGIAKALLSPFLKPKQEAEQAGSSNGG